MRIPLSPRAVVLAIALILTTANGALAERAKYVFLFIGDGLGLPQLIAAEQYLAVESVESDYDDLIMNDFPAQGFTTTHAADRFITGSAAAATAIGCGVKTSVGMIGMEPNGLKAASVARSALERGMKVGIVSSVSVDHATPAAFYAHVPSRRMYHEISIQMAQSGFHYFAGGGLQDPTGEQLKKKGHEPLGDAMAMLELADYTIVNDKAGFENLTKQSGKVFAYNERLSDGQALPYDIDRNEKDISLVEFTAKGIELLDNPEGFFMMVEGGKIDWACHANDGVAAIHDTLIFDEAIRLAVEFADKHPDETLIVVTGDHECGGMSLGFAGAKYDMSFEVLAGQKGSFMAFGEKLKGYKELYKDGRSFDQVASLIEEFFGLKMSELSKSELIKLEKAFWRSMGGDNARARNDATYLLYGGYDPLTVKLTQLINSKAGIGWTSYSHTGVPVATMARGVGQELFNGYYDNTAIAGKLRKAMHMEPTALPGKGAGAPQSIPAETQTH